MPWTFNPFSGTFDQKGSGGGGSAFFAGEVAAYADLPLDGTAALNSRWLVRSSSGTWPFPNYRQGGIYIRTSIVGASRDNDYTLADTKLPDVFADSAFLLYDNSDSTRNLQFDLGSITTGTTRTLTAPNASGRIQVEGQPIGNTTPAAGTFSTLASSSDATLNGFVIGATSIAPTSGNRTYSTSAGAGVGSVTSGVALVAGSFGTRFACFDNGLNGIRGDAAFGWSSSGAPSSANIDTRLARDAAGIVAQYNGTNAQEFRVYNTFTSATNHERGFLKWSSNVFQIGTEKGSAGGTARALEFQTDGVTRLTVGTDGRIGMGAAPSSHILNISGAVNGGFSAQLTNTGTNPEGWAILLPNMAVAASRAIFYGGTALSARNGFGLNFVNVGAGSTSNRIAFSFNAVDDMLVMRADRRAGINTTAPDRAFEINDASGNCLRLTHNDSNGSAANFCDLLVASDGVTTIAPSGTELVVTKNLNLSTKDLVTDTTTGTKIGTGTTQRIGFFNATPAVQPAAVADATDAASTQARLNDLLARLRTLGLIAT